VRGGRKRRPSRLRCQAVELFSWERLGCAVSLEDELVALLPCSESLIGWHAYQRRVERRRLLDRILANSAPKKTVRAISPLPSSTALYRLLPSSCTILLAFNINNTETNFGLFCRDS